MTQNVDFAEMQELRKQFSLIDQKLDKQRILSDNILKESMKEKLSYIEKWYKDRFRVCIIAIPILLIMFIRMNFHWGFILLVGITAALELILNIKCYKTLNPKNLINLSMTDASENVAKHKQLRRLSKLILLIPMILLISWAILIATGYTWNLSKIAIIACLMIASLTWGLSIEKANKKRLDDVLNHIKELRE